MDKNFDHFGSPDPGNHSHSEGVGANLFADTFPPPPSSSSQSSDGGKPQLSACENLGAIVSGITGAGAMFAAGWESASIFEAVGLGVLVGAELPAVTLIAAAGVATILAGSLATVVLCNGSETAATTK